MKDWLFYSLLALLAWGFWAFLPKIAISWLDPKSVFIYEAMGGALTGLIAYFILRPELGVEIRGIVPSVLTGVAGFLGILCFLFAIRTGKVSVVAPLTALYPVLSLALAVIFFREKMNLVQLAGIVLAVISVVLISQE
jgi:bacterial/archaeal transporter family protein